MNINYFTYYYDIINDTTYIERNIYELCIKYNIETNSKPRIINSKNCYSIEEDKLKEFINRSNYIGNRVLILVDTKEIYRKSKLLTICKYNNELFIPQEVVEIYKNINNNKRIKVDGKLYIKVTEEELENIKNAYKNRNIKLEKEIKDIIPLKK